MVVVLADPRRGVELRPGGDAQVVDEAAQLPDGLARPVARPREEDLRVRPVALHRRPRLPQQQLDALGEDGDEPAHLGGDAAVLGGGGRHGVGGQAALERLHLAAQRDHLPVAVADLAGDEDAAAAERGRVDPDAHVRGPQQRRLVDLGDEHGAPGGDQRGEGGHASPHAGAAVRDGAEEPAEHDALGDIGVLRRQAEPEPRDVEPVGHGGHEHGEPALGEEDAADGERRQHTSGRLAPSSIGSTSASQAANAVMTAGKSTGAGHRDGRRRGGGRRGTTGALYARAGASSSAFRWIVGQSSSASPGASTRTSVSGASSAARSA